MLLCVDIGTSNFKAAIFDYDGNRIAFTRQSLLINSDCQKWISAYENCRKQLEPQVPDYNNKIEAIVITGNGPTLVPVLDNDSTAEARLWLDRAAEKYREEASNAMGGFVDAKFFLPKIIKIKNEETQLYNRTKYFLGCPEYLAYKLTGKAFTVFPSRGFDRWFWNEDALLKLDLDGDKFPPFISPGGIFGYTGNIPVLSGGPDFFSAILGAGITKPGQALDRTGTSEGINLCAESQNNNPKFMSYGHPIKPYYNLSYVIKSAGMKLNNICGSLGLANINDFFELAMREQAYAKTILENMCLSVKEIILMMEESGEKITELRVTGGLSENSYFNQMKKEITGKKIIELEKKEAELLGCAIIGSCSLGKRKNYSEACEKMVKIKKIYG